MFLRCASYEPHCEKTCLLGFQPGTTQTGLYSQEDGYRLEISDIDSRAIVLCWLGCKKTGFLMKCLFYDFSLQFFKDVPNCRILVCGGDGTVGWLLEAMGRSSWKHLRTKVTPSFKFAPSILHRTLTFSVGWLVGWLIDS